MISLLHAVAERGVTFFDTAEIYGAAQKPHRSHAATLSGRYS
jgi:aryl-alcohol dehydrogenase-like predicted oxidoreductase